MKRLTDPAIAAATPDAAPGVGPRRDVARLRLGFSDDTGVTRMTERSHFGPLRVQKPLYPEHPSICHAIIVHPPGGIVGGDELHINATLGDQAHTLLTTPGAGKWYRANGNLSHQYVTLQAAAGARLEWLPQETIFFNEADVRLEHTVTLAADACYIGGEILCFGRTASGESFTRGSVGQRISIRRDGKLLWFEQGVLQANAASMHSPLSLAGYTVCATLIAVGKTMSPAFLQTLREETAVATEDGRSGATQMKQILVARYLGHSSEAARHWMARAWQRIRPELMTHEAVIPRIWNT